MKYNQFRSFPLYRQRDDAECGLACLAMLFSYYGCPNLLAYIRSKYKVKSEGSNLLKLESICQDMGFESASYQAEYKFLFNADLPCIAHVDHNHFVVVYRCDEHHVWLANPASGKQKLSVAAFLQRWTGIAMQVRPSLQFDESRIDACYQQQCQLAKTVRRKFYYPALKPFRNFILVAFVLSLFTQLMGLVLPVFLNVFIDRVIPQQDTKLLTSFVYGLVASLGLVMIFSYFRNILLSKISVGFEEIFFRQFFDHLVHIPTDYFDAFKKEDLFQRFAQNQKIREGMSANLMQTLLDMIFLVNFVILMLYYNLSLGGIATLIILLALSVTVFSTSKIHRLENRVFTNTVKASELVLDTIAGIHTVKLLNAEKQRFQQWLSVYSEGLKELYVSIKAKVNTELLIRLTYTLGQVLIFVVGAFFVLQTKMNAGEYVAFVTLFSIAVYSLGSISGVVFIASDLLVAYERLNDVFMQSREKHETHERQCETQAEISLEHLYFKYNQEDNDTVLSDINLELPYGKKLAIVGRNGSGKTTLVSVMAGLYTRYQGSVKIARQEVKHADLDLIRQRIHLIPQDIYLFAGSIKDNILLANPNANEQQLQRVIQLAGLEEVLQLFYFGLDHQLIHNGQNLSGGQRRKIAFARLFISNPDIIILDEGSNALDVKTEKVLMDNVADYFADRTIIYITHRLNTLKLVEEILVLEDGSITEHGDYDALMQRQGLFYEFVNT